MSLIASKAICGCVRKPRKFGVFLMLIIIGAALGPSSRLTAAEQSDALADPITSAAKSHRKKPQVEPTPIALPADLKVPSYTPASFPFHEGERLVYEASWIGIPAARGWFELHRNKKNPAVWNVEAWIETNKVVDLVYRMRDYTLERVSVGSLRARDIYQVQHENQRANEYTITFDERDKRVVSTKKNHKGTETHEFIADDPVGPISGAMMALSQQLVPGDHLLFDVFSGTNRYVFSFDVDGKERVQVPVGTFDALKVTPGVVYLSNGKLRNQARGMTIWISADRQHLPLRMEAATFIGTVRADLIQIDGPAPVRSE